MCKFCTSESLAPGRGGIGSLHNTTKVLKATQLPERRLVVITVSTGDVHAIRPFQTYALTELTDLGETVLEHSTSDIALTEHDVLVRSLRDAPVMPSRRRGG